jgi:hypothetical protein
LEEQVLALWQQVEQLKREQSDRKTAASAVVAPAPDSKPGTTPPAPPAAEEAAARTATATDSPKPAKPGVPEPFAFADFTWLNGNSRQKDSVLDTKAFTGEFRLDAN